MMKKIVFLILFTLTSLFGVEKSFLSPEEAFIYQSNIEDEKVNISLQTGKDIYLYDDQLKLMITKPENIDITEDVGFPKPEEYDGFIVHHNGVNIEIPFSLLQEKVKSDSYELEFHFQGCSKAGLCYPPMSKTITVGEGDFASKTNASEKTTSTANAQDLNETDSIAATLKDSSAILVLATFFGFGLLLSFTPCVFPMIPILSSIIVKAGDKGELTAARGFFLSLVYVLAMAAAYTIAGVLAGLFGANLQVALQNPYVLVVFAAIFVALAFSMFGYFKLELPQSIQNKINKTTDGKEKQGVLGVAIMGFLSALIVGPCVAPPLAGALVYIGQTGDAVLGGAALFVMSLGMGVPLLLIGLGAGKFMPKPGGWMDSITKIFGIVMLAIAVWMLDRVLDPIIVMYLWALLFLGTAIYLKQYEHILIKLITLVILIYGVISFTGAVSGATNILNPLEKFTSGKVALEQKELTFHKVKNIAELEQAIESSTKPVMLDFYADWCISCKELEGITFKDEKVIEALGNFTLLKADVTKNTKDDKELQKKFQVVGPPALIFWDKDKNIVNKAKIVGYKNPEEFLKIINENFK